jgi:serine/threonine-protein kinase
LRLLEETAPGLGYAYSRGMTHRDIKATNILIATAKNAKLVDFGLAELTGSRQDVEGTVDQSVDYVGLEKATGTKAGDIRSDIFSISSFWVASFIRCSRASRFWK